jgi:cytochrome b6-f complex iron-sulfur subunit
MIRREGVRRIAIGGITLLVIPSVLTSCVKEDTDPEPGPGTGSGTGTGTGTGNSTKIDLSLPSNQNLASKDGFIIVSNIIVINTGSDKFVALSSVCTHEGCAISYNPSAGNLPCPCHGSIFALTGGVLNGPALGPLTVYKVTKSGNILTIE